MSVIPKTSKIERIRENKDIFDFDLTEEDADAISSLNCNLRFNNPGDFCKIMGGSLPIFG